MTSTILMSSTTLILTSLLRFKAVVPRPQTLRRSRLPPIAFTQSTVLTPRLLQWLRWRNTIFSLLIWRELSSVGVEP